MIQRPLYTEKIEAFIDKPVIKVITGIRRSGKSGLLKLIHVRLAERGVAEDQIVYINYESMRWAHLRTAEALYEYVDKVRPQQKKVYLLFDEIQEVNSWETAINSMMADWDVDLYITGSNSKLLSSELSTHLAGRYVECRMYPLSFREFVDFHGYALSSQEERAIRFNQYLRQGGFPGFHIAEFDDESIYLMARDIYNSVLLRDAIQRYRIRNVDILERLVQFVFNNIGNTFSALSISKYLKSQGRSLDTETLYNYLQAIESSFVISRARRYDLRAKDLLQTNEKYYVADLSLVYSVGGYNPQMIGAMLENVVYLELLRRGYQVAVGKQGRLEVDFVARQGDDVLYVQVTENMGSDETRQRELRPLIAIHDNYPKYIVTNNLSDVGVVDGVKCIMIYDFLLKDFL